MPRGFLVGRLFGTDIFCSPYFFLLIGLLLWQWGLAQGATISAAVLVSLLVHEFGHVFAVKWFMKEESVVVLVMFGGLTIHRPPRGDLKQAAGKQIGISLMGPAFSLGLAMVFLGAAMFIPATGAVELFFNTMLFINVIWTAANLLPIVPLDGGQAARAGLAMAVGRLRASNIMRVVSIAGAGLALAAALAVGWPFAAVIAGFLILQNLAPVRA